MKNLNNVNPFLIKELLTANPDSLTKKQIKKELNNLADLIAEFNDYAIEAVENQCICGLISKNEAVRTTNKISTLTANVVDYVDSSKAWLKDGSRVKITESNADYFLRCGQLKLKEKGVFGYDIELLKVIGIEHFKDKEIFLSYLSQAFHDAKTCYRLSLMAINREKEEQPDISIFTTFLDVDSHRVFFEWRAKEQDKTGSYNRP